MKKHIARIALFSLVAAALVAVPAASRAQEKSTNAPAAVVPGSKNMRLPFHGKVIAADAVAMTFGVGTMTLNVTSETKITKNGQPAVFADITVGEMITGAYKKDEAGKLNALTVRLNAKPVKETKKPAEQAPVTPVGN